MSAVQQGKKSCPWRVGFWDRLLWAQPRKRLFPGCRKKGCGHSFAHHSKVSSTRHRSAHRRLGNLQKVTRTAQCQRTSSCCAWAQFCWSPYRCSYARGGIQLESAQTGAEKKKGIEKSRSTVLSEWEDVAAMERRQSSSSHAEFSCHFAPPISYWYSCSLNWNIFRRDTYPINMLVPVLFKLSIEETMTKLPDLNFLSFLLSSFSEIKRIVMI